jgi:D-alanyl-D-alanine carboxypeptidase (penicillin-binding protein 5/6)
MLKLLRCTALAVSVLMPLTAVADLIPPPQLEAKAWALVDHATGQTLAEKDADARIEPASLTKLMTAYITFSKLKEGSLKPDQVVPVSTKAWRMEGSRMFIEPNKPVSVDELIRGVIVQSGNDACVALAETIAGSEEAFAALMNREAQRLGMTNTHFTNSTGLPDPQLYTSVRATSPCWRARSSATSPSTTACIRSRNSPTTASSSPTATACCTWTPPSTA